ncbi:MAG: NAD(P)/FAD-dependent oxidoreductase [Archaeoglobaceae archaeon]
MNFVIIGGSVAGLEAAICLAKLGKVTLYEEHKEIGLPVQCAEGWIRFTGVEPYIRGRAIKEADMVIMDRNYNEKSRITIKLNGAVVIVDRANLEKKMASIAEKNGAEIITGVRIEKLSQLLKMHENLDLVVDASGYPSLWCKEFGGKKPCGIAIQAFTDRDIDKIVVEFHPELNGYFWIFPKAGEGSKVGAGSFVKQVSKLLRIMLDEMMNKTGLIDGGFIPKSYTARPVACYRNSPFLRHLKGIPIALVGDSAGLVDLGGGEGMTKAIISSRVLAECVERGELEKYEEIYYRRMRTHYLIANIFAFARRHPALLRLFGKIGLFDFVLEKLTSQHRKIRFNC